MTNIGMIVSERPPLTYIHLLKLRYFRYAGIFHNKDTKHTHYHLIIQFQNKYGSKFKLVSLLSKFENNIYVEPVRNLKKSLEYLIHKNDLSKYQYDLSEIMGKNGEKWEQHIKYKNI